MNWISSQSEQELRISMNKLGEGEKEFTGLGDGRDSSQKILLLTVLNLSFRICKIGISSTLLN